MSKQLALHDASIIQAYRQYSDRSGVNFKPTHRAVRPLQAFSIFGSLIVGLWTPIRLLGIFQYAAADLLFDLFIPIVAAANVALHFLEHHRSPREWKTWLRPSMLADLACVIPWAMIDHFFLPGGGQSLMLINFLGVRHVWRVKGFLEEFASLPPILYRLVPIGVTMPLLVHMLSCAWIAMGSGTAGPDPEHRGVEYIKAEYWAFTTLTTVGYGDISAKTPGQMLFASIVQITGVGVFGFVISNVAAMLSRMDAAREHHMESLDKIETYMNSHKIPPELRAKVRDYYQYLWKHHKGYQDNTLLQDLPSKMQSEMFLYINKSVIERIPFFQGASEDLLEDLMNSLTPRIFVPGERIFHVDEPGDAMYIVHSGGVDILTREGKAIASLESGAFFGEMALITNGRRTATARAKGYTYAYVLEKSSFQDAIDTYPEFRKHVEEMAQARSTPAPAKKAA